MHIYKILQAALLTLGASSLIACNSQISSEVPSSAPLSSLEAENTDASLLEMKVNGEICTSALEHQDAKIACPAGQTITQIIFASYGSPTGTCGAYKANSCNAANSMTVVKNACLGRPSCTLNANNGSFGDPCPGIQKSLIVDIVCSASTSTTATPTPKPTATPATTGSSVCAKVAEHSSASISCPAGKIVSKVSFASYGNATGSCGGFSLGSCNASTSLSVVEAACIGKASCAMNANNGPFGDPCSGTQKSLTVQVECAASTSGATPTPTATPMMTPTPTPKPTATPTPVPTTAGAALGDPNIFLTPETWIINGTSSIESSNPGAYLKMGFTGTSFKILIDSNTLCGELPKIGYTIDGSAMQYITIASYNSNLTVPVASGLASGNHQIRLSIEGMGYSDRWKGLGIQGSPGVTNSDRLYIKQILLDPGAKSLPPVLNPKRIVTYGDSITEGANTLAGMNFVKYKQWSTTWGALLAEDLDAEVTTVAWQGQGYIQPGQGNVPGLLDAYNMMKAGMARKPSKPDYVIVHHGANGSFTAADVAKAIKNLRAMYPSAEIYIGVPFYGYNRPVITAGFNSQNDPKVYFFDMGAEAEKIVAATTTDGGHISPAGYAQLEPLMLKYIPHK